MAIGSVDIPEGFEVESSPAAPDYAALEKQYGLPSGLLAADQHFESGGNPNAISPKGAVGVAQFMPATAKAYGITDSTDPTQATTGQARMFADLSKQYGGDLPKMLAAYNWGSGNLDKHGLENAPQETRDYIKHVTSRLGGDGMIHGTGEFSGNTTDPATGKIYYEGQYVADTGKTPGQYAQSNTGTTTDALPPGFEIESTPQPSDIPEGFEVEQPSDSTGTILGKIVNNVMPDAWQGAGGVLKSIGTQTGSKTIHEVGDALVKAGESNQQPIKTAPDASIRRNLAGLGQGVADLLAGGGTPVSMIADSAVGGYGNTYNKQEGAPDASLRALDSGILNTVLMGIPIGKVAEASGVPQKIIMGMMSGVPAGMLMTATDKAINSNVDQHQEILDHLKDIAEGGVQGAEFGGLFGAAHAIAGKPTAPTEAKSITPQDLRGANTPEEAAALAGQSAIPEGFEIDTSVPQPKGEPNAPTTRSNEIPESPSVAEAPAAPESPQAVIDGNVTGNTPSITAPDAALSPVDAAAAEAAQSPLNNLPEPTDAQKEAGNYKKAHIKIHGLDVAIETPKGATRSGTDANGEPWSVDMKNHYGYVKRTMGADGDQVDVYVGDHPESDKAYIVDQNDLATGNFDEHKTILGATNKAQARAIYESGFSDGKGAERIGGITEMPVEKFKEWLKKPQTEPLVKPIDTAALEQRYARYGFKGLDQRMKVLARQPNPHPAEVAIVQKYRAQKALLPNQSQPRNPNATPKKSRDLLQFIKDQGGILPTDESRAELGVMDLNKHLAAGGLVSNRGKHPDYMREAAAEAGYLPQDSSVADFWSKLHDNAQGQRVYTPEAAPQEQIEDPAEKEHYAQSLADEYGISTEGKAADQILADVSSRQVEKATAEEAEGYGDAWEDHADTIVDDILQDGDIPFDTGDFYGQKRTAAGEDQSRAEAPESTPRTGSEPEAVAGEGGESEGGAKNADIGTGGVPEGAGGGKVNTTEESASLSQKEKPLNYSKMWSKKLHNRIKELRQKLEAGDKSVAQELDRAEAEWQKRRDFESDETQRHLLRRAGMSHEEIDARLAEDNRKLAQMRSGVFEQDQSIIPGAEKISDKQLAERRMDGGKKASVPQKSAGSDGGLFDTEGRKEQDLFAQPVKSQSNVAESKETNDFNRSTKDADIAGKHAAAKDFVLDKGKDGNEHLLALGADGKAQRYIKGGRTFITFDDALKQQLSKKENNIQIHHNHPDGQPLSREDMDALNYPGLRIIVAHGEFGSVAAHLTRNGKKWLDDSDGTIMGIYDKALEAAQQSAGAREFAGDVTGEESAPITLEAANRAMAEAGIINYASSYPVDTVSADVYKDIQDAANAAAKKYATSKGYDYENPATNPSDNPPISVIRPGEMAEFLGRNARDKEQNSGSAGSDKGSEGSAEKQYSTKRIDNSEEKAPTFYSAVTRAVENAKQPKASAEQWLATIRNTPGVKQEELDWLGLKDWLDQQKGSVTKEQVADFLRQNEVQVKEVTKGGNKARSFEDWAKDYVSGAPTEADRARYDRYVSMGDPLTGGGKDDTKFSAYQIPGGENYRELLLTLPKIKSEKKFDPSKVDIKRKVRSTTQGSTSLYYDGKLLASYGDDPAPHPDGQYRQKSDEYWMQVAKDVFEKGDPRNSIDSQSGTYRSSHFDEPNIIAHVRFNDRTDADGKKTLFMEEAQSDWHQAGRKKGYQNPAYEGSDFKDIFNQLGAVPNAPFKTSWHELAMKRMLRYAAENGYDKLAWTTGEQQNDRYDLSKQVDKIDYRKTGDNKYSITPYKGGSPLALYTGKAASEVEDIIGKDATQKIVDSGKEFGSLRGLDLKVGGEGMKGFYDKILPSFMNKYAKKWGGRVGESSVKSEHTTGRYIYDGPIPTIDAVREVSKISDGRGEVKKSPVTGEDMHYSLTRVSVSGPMRKILRAMENGDSFKDAISKEGTPEIAQIFGGDVTDEKVAQANKVHSIDITPSMRESVMQGQPMFSTKQAFTERAEKDIPAIKDEIQKIAQRMNPKVDVRFADKLFGEGEALARSGASSTERQEVAGAYTPARKLVEVSLDLSKFDPTDTAYHELWHSLEENLTPGERALMLDKFPGNDSMSHDEQAATAFADYAVNKSAKGLLPAVRRVFTKVKGFFSDVGAALRKSGYKSADDIFSAAERGKVGKREQKSETKAATAYKSESDLEEHAATARAEAYHDDGEPRTDRSLTSIKSTDGRKNLMIDGILEGQPINSMIRLPFQVMGGVNAKGEYRPGRAITDKAAWLATTAKFKEDGRFQFLNPALESARSGLINHYGMDEAYKEVRQNRKKTEKAILNQGLDIHKLMEDNGIGVNEATVLHSILTGDAIPDEHWAKISEPIRQAMDQFGQDLVDLNLLSNESYERNKGKYLHRSYVDREREAQQQTGLMAWGARQQNVRRKAIRGNQLKGRGVFVELSPESLGGAKAAKGQKFSALEKVSYKENADTGEDVRNIHKRTWMPEGDKIPDAMKDWEKSGWEVRDVSPDGKKITVWRDYTKDERLKMGEVLDARYNIIKTVQLMAHDISTGKMFADIASNAEWATKAPERGDKVATPAEYRRRETMAKYDWVRVPDTSISETGGKKIWGALAGTYVRPEIWRDINETKKLYGSNGVWGTLLRQWKSNKTFRSPATHMHNIIANVMSSHLQDIRLMDMARAVHSIKTKDGFHQLADEHGAFGSNYVENEITRKVLESVLNDITKSENPQKSTTQAMHDFLFKLHEHGYKAFKKLDNGMMNLYQMEDNVFRMALFHRRLSLGDTPEQAANEARVGFVDYDITAPWVNAARSSVLPFVSWTYQQVPVLAKAMALRPWKLAAWVGLMYAANAMSYALVPGDEDKERALMDDDHQGSVWGMFPRMMRLPMADAQGRPQYMDLRRIVPAGDLADLTQGHAAMNIPPALMPGGPLMLAGEYLFNRQSFTGKDMTNELTDTWGDKAGKVADWAWKSWMPNSPFIPGSYAWNKMKTGITGGKDYFRKEYSPTQAALAVSGINVQSFDAQEEAFWRAHEINATKDGLIHEMRQAADQHDRGLIGDQEAAKTSARTMEKFGTLQKKAESTFNPPKTNDPVKDAIIQFIRGNGEMPQATPEQIRAGAAAASPALGRIIERQQGVAR